MHTPKIDPRISEHVDLTNRGGLGGLEKDTVCVLRILMVCFERQGVNPTSTDAYKMFCDFAEKYSKNI